MPTIPSLPEHLREVPDLLERGDEDNRARWLAWRIQVEAYRALIHKQIAADPSFLTTIEPLCAADPAYALVLFGVVYEPRTRGGRGGAQAFIPFGWQVDLIRWFESRMELDMADGYVSKARGLGATYIFCWLALHGWLWKSPFDSLLVSRNAEQVDRKGDKKGMFYKIDLFLDNMPDAYKPKGYDPAVHRTTRLMVNPENGNTISGDATTVKAGRGDRVTFMLFDEAANIPGFGETWATGEGTTDHRFAISTESMEEGPEFHEMWTMAKAVNRDAVLELDWWRNPYFDEAWYAMSRERAQASNQLHAWDREYGRNMMAGIGAYIYEYARSIAPMPLTYQPGQGRVLYCCVDPGINDETAYVWVQYDPGYGTYRILEAYMRGGQDSRFHTSIFLGTPVSGPYEYDLDAREVMAWTGTIRDPIIYVGDPYGENRGGESAKSFYEGIATASKELSGGRVQIYVRTSWEPEDRGYDGRQEALRDMLPRCEFNDTPRVRRVLHALTQYRYKMPTGRDVTTISKHPIRIPGDHYIAALEYLAVHRRVGSGTSGMTRAKAVRQAVNGLSISERMRS